MQPLPLAKPGVYRQCLFLPRTEILTGFDPPGVHCQGWAERESSELSTYDRHGGGLWIWKRCVASCVVSPGVVFVGRGGWQGLCLRSAESLALPEHRTLVPFLKATKPQGALPSEGDLCVTLERTSFPPPDPSMPVRSTLWYLVGHRRNEGSFVFFQENYRIHLPIPPHLSFMPQ